MSSTAPTQHSARVHDPWQAWLDAHPEEVRRHSGCRIAVHPDHGIVAVGTSYEELSAKLTALGFPPGQDDELAIEVVPRRASK